MKNINTWELNHCCARCASRKLDERWRRSQESEPAAHLAAPQCRCSHSGFCILDCVLENFVFREKLEIVLSCHIGHMYLNNK